MTKTHVIIAADEGRLAPAYIIDRGIEAVRRSAARLTTLMVAPVARLFDSTKERSADNDMALRFDRLVLPHLDAAYNFARFLSRDADGAQDIIQEAFLRAYRNFDGYRGGDMRSWIFAIVRNCYHAWLQEGRRRLRHEAPMYVGGDGSVGGDEIASEDETPEAALIRKTESQCVRSVIAALPEPLREVLVLRELEQLSYRQIADVIDLPIGTVMSRLARARQEFGIAWRSKMGNQP